jgi:ATP-dependent helicase/nuclease subunit B
MAAGKANVFNIPAAAPFLPVLIDALLAGTLVPGFPKGGDPLDLARATLYLPTRRAGRLARDVFLDRLGAEAAILPRIVALGDLDEDEIAFADAASGLEALALEPAFAPLERRLALAELISKWATAITPTQGAPLIANTPGAAIALADALARLMDDMITRQVPWKNLDRLVSEDLDKYWQESLNFLQFVHPQWNGILTEQKAIEAADRRDQLIAAEAKRLAHSDAPVIAAGSTGSMPATAALLAIIATLPHGAVVLPGLDLNLGHESWALIAGDGKDGHDGLPATGHPQFAMHALLERMSIKRAEVKQLGETHGREALVSEALRPAATTDRWRERLVNKDFDKAVATSLATLTMIEAANAEEEALAIAVAMREALDEPKKTVALVTPDRALARRVKAALARWDVAVDDSGGDALADTAAGLFARLAAQVALGGLEPVPLLALLKHPLLRLGQPQGRHDQAVSALERAVLRGPRPKAGSGNLAHALETFRANRDKMHRSDPRHFIRDNELDAAAALIAQLAQALGPLETLKAGAHWLATLAQRHREVIVLLSAEDKDTAAFANHDGTALADALDQVVDSKVAEQIAVERKDYAELFYAVLGDRMVRRPESRDLRARIYGLLEARLQHVDRVVLGSLNEGSWPPETRTDPWLSRPMRRKLGLDPPERRIGLSAHDFAQALGAGEVILARAAKVAGSPTVTSRFVQRIAALAGPRWDAVVKRGELYLHYARALDAPAVVAFAKRPEPSPPLEVRPAKLSVTDIENWLRDPYTIYAKHVLKLVAFDAVDTPPGVADRGNAIHDAIGEFTAKFTGALPADAEQQLVAFGEKSFAPFNDFPEAQAFWWPRFCRIAHWFVGFERERRPTLAAIYSEISGALPIPLGPTIFTLTARADRIERRADGSYAIVDYKTGQPPTEPQVRTGLSPQLTLEGAILRGGGFEEKGVARGALAQLLYVRLKGGEPPGEPKLINFKQSTPDDQADRALQKLTEIARKFLVDGEAYRSLVHPMWAKHYGDYDHLARVKEWAASGGETEYEGPPS